MGKLFVTVLAGFVPSRQVTSRRGTRTRSSARNKTYLTGLILTFFTILYCDRANTQYSAQPDGKKHAIPVLSQGEFPG
jgi:hypothetical protein